MLPARAMPRGLSRGQAPAYVGISPTLFEAGASGTAMNAHTPILDPWPRLMRAETAARYVDERSVQAFRRSVGKLYPRPIKLSGKGER